MNYQVHLQSSKLVCCEAFDKKRLENIRVISSYVFFFHYLFPLVLALIKSKDDLSEENKGECFLLCYKCFFTVMLLDRINFLSL